MFTALTAPVPVVATFHAYAERSLALAAFAPLLTKVWKIDPTRLHVSCFEGNPAAGIPRDIEAADPWCLPKASSSQKSFHVTNLACGGYGRNVLNRVFGSGDDCYKDHVAAARRRLGFFGHPARVGTTTLRAGT